jgi:hypothetical protein
VSRNESLSVLVVGTDDWAVAQAQESLQAGGLVGLTCHEPGEACFPCNALKPGRTCPLDAGAKVVLVVRARPFSEPTPGETGAVCALHAQLPLITSGMGSNSPFARFADAEVSPSGDFVDACERAIKSKLEIVADLSEKAFG